MFLRRNLMTQCDLILTIIKRDGHISKRVADTYRIENLKGRICDLRDRGHRIMTTFKKDALGKKYARYSLEAVQA
jgi:hypothetical protein